MKLSLALGFSLLGCVLLGACAIRSEDPELVDVPLTVKFPSVDAAALVDTIEVEFFDASQGCDVRMQQRRAGTLEEPLATTEADSVCRYANGSASLRAPLGDHVLIATARLGDKAVYAGCVQQVLGTGAPILPISLSWTGEGVAPSRRPQCPLAAFCAGSCTAAN